MKNVIFLMAILCLSCTYLTAQISGSFQSLSNSSPTLEFISNNGIDVNWIDTNNDGDFVIYSNGTFSDERFRINDNTGFIGINNPVPSQQLDVTGSINASSFLFSNRLRIAGNSDGNAWATGVTGDGIYREGKLWITPKASATGGDDGGLTLTNFDETDNWTIASTEVAFVNGSTSYYLGFTFNNALKSFIVDTNGSYNQTSDRNLKKNIESMPSVLANVKKLQASKYHYLDNEESVTKSIGFMAQDTHPMFPELVSIEEAGMGINYAGFSVVAIKAIQEQQEMIEDLQAELAEIKEMLSQR